jgi:hypothetical protein
MTRSRARLLDQFYTDPRLAQLLVTRLRAYLGDRQEGVRWLEPSAGGGAFLDALPAEALALDLEPADPRVEQGDFLNRPFDALQPWVVVGNPPFGKNAALAIRFFNHAATFAQVIAFIVPRTFQKGSVQRRLHARFHLEQEWEIPEDAFVFEGQPVHVPCVFQIWGRQDGARAHQALPTTHPDFAYTAREQADFAFQRVGARAGAIKDIGPDQRGLAAPSHHFIRVTDRAQVAAVRARFESLDWTAIKHRTAGNPSIAKTELVAQYEACKLGSGSPTPA